MNETEVLFEFFDNLQHADPEAGQDLLRVSKAFEQFMEKLKGSKFLSREQALIIHYFGQEFPSLTPNYVSETEAEVILELFEMAANWIEAELTGRQDLRPRTSLVSFIKNHLA